MQEDKITGNGETASIGHASIGLTDDETDTSGQNTIDKPCACGKQGCSCGSEAVKATPPHMYMR